jgi:hypothetical protein
MFAPGHDQSADLGRVLGGCLERDPTAERVAHEVRPDQPEVVGQSGDVVGHEADVNRPIDIGSPAMPLQVNRYDLVALRQHRKDRP